MSKKILLTSKEWFIYIPTLKLDSFEGWKRETKAKEFYARNLETISLDEFKKRLSLSCSEYQEHFERLDKAYYKMNKE